MDRVVSNEEKRKKRRKSLIKILGVLAGVVIIIWVISLFLKESLS